MLGLTQAIINGLLIGGVYGLITIGLTLVFGVMRVVNFAQGEFLMLGMFGAYFAWRLFGIDPIVSALAIGIIVGLLGVVVERLVIEPIVQANHLSQIFATVGVSLVLLNGSAVLFGNEFYSVHTAYQTSTLGLGALRLSVPSLISFGWAVTMVIALQAFLFYTDAGRALRATAQNRDAAVLMGINPRRMFMMAFGIGVGLTAVAGAVILPYTTVTPQSGQQYVVIMFTVMVLGGLTSIRGALAGGLVVGVVQSVSTVFLPTSLQNLVVFLVFLAALAVTRTDRKRAGWRMQRFRVLAFKQP